MNEAASRNILERANRLMVTANSLQRVSEDLNDVDVRCKWCHELICKYRIRFSYLKAYNLQLREALDDTFLMMLSISSSCIRTE